MKSLPEQACAECCEMIKALELLQWKLKEAKRLGTLDEIRIGLSAVQMDFGAVKVQASGLKAHVCAACGAPPRAQAGEIEEPACVSPELDASAPERIFQSTGDEPSNNQHERHEQRI